MSLTDEIYRELLDGLEKGSLDWQQFLTKHSNSKGPLYNAIARFFSEVGAKVTALHDEKNRVQNELNQTELRLDSLDQKTKEGESNIASLEKRENVLNGQAESLEVKLAEKSEVVKHLAELEKLGFNTERLGQLVETLREIGVKHAVKGKEAVRKFFDDLKDYDLVLGAELQLRGLKTQIATKKLEAKNWQAKEETLRRKHDNSKEATEAVLAILAKGIKASQIVTWHQILNRFQTVEQFEKSLAQYGDITKLLRARQEEAENGELRLAKIQSHVKTLEKERVKIEGAIDAIRVAGVKQLETIAEAAKKQLEAMSADGVERIRAVGQKIGGELGSFLDQLDSSFDRVFETGRIYETMKQNMQKYQPLKDALESHRDVSEQPK